MRPLILTMHCFGPFLDETIDFSKLGDHLFLISGPTGSGKSTIFDAICYALYGTTSSDGRDGASMKSDFADPAELCRVILTFAVGRDRYRIERQPKQTAMNSQNTKLIEKAAACHLWQLTGDDDDENNDNHKSEETLLADSIRECNQKIRDILGLSDSQFKQIVMLPQGQFSRLLKSEEKERIALLKTLFPMDYYRHFEQAVTAARQKADEAVGRVSERLDVEIHRLQAIPNTRLDKALLSETPLPTGQILALADMDIDRDTRERNRLKAAIDEMAARQETLAQALGINEAVNARFDKLKAVKAERARLQDKADAMAARQHDIDAVQTPKLEKYIKEQNLLENLSPQIALLQEKKDMLADVSRQIAALDERIAKNAKRQAAQEKAAADLAVCNDKQIALSKDVLSARADLQHLTAQAGHLDKARTIADAIGESETVMASLQNKTKAIQDKLTALEKRQETLEAQGLDTVTGRLAAKLTDGKPCPVCGAIHHPHPAEIHGNVKKVAREMDTNSNTIAHLKGKLAAAEERVKLRHDKIDADRASLDALKAEQHITFTDTADLKAQQQTISDKQKQLTQKLTALEGQLSAVKKRIPPLEKAAQATAVDDSLAEQRSTAVQQQERLKGEISVMQSQITTVLTKMVPAAGGQETQVQADYDHEVARLKNAIQKTRNAIDNGRQRIAEWQARLKSAEIQLEDLTEELKGKRPQDLSALRLEKNRVSYWVECYRAAMEQVQSRLTTNRQERAQIHKLITEGGNARAHQNVITDLYDTVKGTVKGCPKISFERYILSAYLQDILISANVFLEDVSDSRYHLMLPDDPNEKGNRGLSIAVYDDYTGKTRSADSLSGGETFMAALSMALGLSDLVQSDAGGIRLDTLFIDEGFATLDADALEKAMDCLSRLQRSGRTVGIISHVQELLDIVDDQIIVEKTEAGSFTRCVTTAENAKPL